MSWYDKLLRKVTEAAEGAEVETTRHGESGQEVESFPEAPVSGETMTETGEADAPDHWAEKDAM